jgi:hypothetical protein
MTQTALQAARAWISTKRDGTENKNESRHKSHPKQEVTHEKKI